MFCRQGGYREMLNTNDGYSSSKKTPSAFHLPVRPTKLKTLSAQSHSASRTPSPSPSFIHPDSPKQLSDNGQCGLARNMTCAGATFGACCSGFGWCGDTTLHCGKSCQPSFGHCDDDAISTASGTTLQSLLSKTKTRHTSSVKTASKSKSIVQVATPAAVIKTSTSTSAYSLKTPSPSIKTVIRSTFTPVKVTLTPSSFITKSTVRPTSTPPKVTPIRSPKSSIHPTSTPQKVTTSHPSVTTKTAPSSLSRPSRIIPTSVHTLNVAAKATKTSKAKSLKEILREKYGDAYAMPQEHDA
jgi:hypothetical protein